MSTASLPNNSSLDKMRREAKLLQRGVRDNHPEALALVARHHPDGVSEGLPLHAAQVVVARAHGFASWARRKHFFDSTADLRFDGSDQHTGDGSAADEFCRLASLDYADDGPQRWASARQLLAKDPGLPFANIWAAASAIDIAAVRDHLARDPGLATRRGGPFRWTPLYYLSYSRLAVDVTEDAVLTIGRLLLAAGADPHEGYLWGGQPTPFTLLTGAFGEGELGPERQPRHPHALALARLLLAAGADPNDGQTLYNRMFEPGNDHLELLFEFGLGTGGGGLWRARVGEALQSPAELLQGQLSWAIDHGFTDRVRLLLNHGVDLGSVGGDAPPPVEAALLAGQPAIAGLLLAAGAPPARLDAADQLLAAALVGDRAAVDRLTGAAPAALLTARQRRPGVMVRAAAHGWIDAVRLFAELGFDVNAKGHGDTPIEEEWQTPLHQAAADGNAEMVRLLLALGADTGVRDRRFDATPADWARHFGHESVAALIDR